MEDQHTTLIKGIKTSGSMAMYVGTASLIRPIVKRHNQDRNGITRFCTTFAGTVISCGIAHAGSKWFDKIVDKVSGFFNDISAKPKRKEDRKDG